MTSSSEQNRPAASGKPPNKRVTKGGTIALAFANPKGILEVPEGNRLYPRGGISETGASLDPRPIVWLVSFAAVPLVLGNVALMTRLVLGMSSGASEMALLALHTVGCIVVLVAYFGKSTTVGGISTKDKL